MTTINPSKQQAIAALDTLKAFLVGSATASDVATAAAQMASGKIWVYPYNSHSESAKDLATALGAQRIKREDSAFIGKAGDVIVNWGSGTGNFQAKVGKARVLNPPQLIDKAINKRDFFSAMLGLDGPRLPFWTTSDEQAKAWISSGYIVIGREKLEGSKGEGIRVMKNAVDFHSAKLYTMMVPSTTEFRVYVFDGVSVDAREKRLKSGGTADTNGMRYDETNYLFCEHVSGSNTVRVFPNHVPQDVLTQAEKAAKKLGLLTGGIDVLWDGSKAFVLEYNTAPYLGDHTTAIYAKLLKAYAACAA